MLRHLISSALAALLWTAVPATAAQQPVAVGTSPNDGSGEPLRTAFTKLNANDAELYASVATLITALGGRQPLDATLSALAGVTTAADKVIYATGADAFATTNLTAFGRSLIATSGAAAAKTLLALAVADVTGCCTARLADLHGHASRSHGLRLARARRSSATTAFVAASYAPLASPALTGTPTAPTATAGTNTTQVATTAFVQTTVGSGAWTAYTPTATPQSGTFTSDLNGRPRPILIGKIAICSRRHRHRSRRTAPQVAIVTLERAQRSHGRGRTRLASGARQYRSRGHGDRRSLRHRLVPL